MNHQLVDNIQQRIAKAQKTLPQADYPFPLYVIIEVTNICNLACVMCPSSTQTRARGVISLDLWRKILDEVAAKSPQSLIWPAIMGEALTAGPVFFDMLDEARDRGLQVVWNTNALLVNAQCLKRLEVSPPKEIIVGLDAAKAETYARIRRPGDFVTARDNTLKLIQQLGGRTRITVQFIEQEENRAELEEFKNYWLAQGAVVKVRPRLGWGLGVEAPELVLEQNMRIGPCPWLVRTVSIHWNGMVAQCDGDWDQRWPVGDLNRQSLEEVWLGELAGRRRRHRNGDFDFDPCRDCKDWQAGLSEFFFPQTRGDHGSAG